MTIELFIRFAYLFEYLLRFINKYPRVFLFKKLFLLAANSKVQISAEGWKIATLGYFYHPIFV